MPMPIQNRLKVLMAEKALRERRKLSYKEMEQESGVPLSVLTLYTAQKVRRYDSETLSKLCRYFECQPGDLLEYYEDEETHNKKKK